MLTFIDHVDRNNSRLPKSVRCISEYAHPNYSGTTALYSKIDHQNFLVDLGCSVRNNDGPRYVCIFQFGCRSSMFESNYNDLGKIMPRFVALCELDLKRTPGSQ